jgi:hypothetical protein
MIFVILMMGLVLVAAAAVVLLLYLANRAAKKSAAPPPPGVGVGAPGPAKPEEPKTVEGYTWNDKFVRVEFERDPVAGGLIDERPSVKDTTIVYKKLYLKGTPNCTNQYDAQARMVPEKSDEPEFLVYYAPNAASVYIARRDCLETQTTSYRYLAAASKTEIEGHNEQTEKGRLDVRKRSMDVGVELSFSADPFAWAVAAHDVPEKTMSLSPLYDPDLFVGVENEIFTVSSTDAHEFRVFLTLSKTDNYEFYDRFKVRFSE